MNSILWIIFLVFCIIVEAATSLSLITIWFMPGAIIATFLAVFEVSVSAQMIVFVLVSFASLIVLKYFIKDRQSKNSESKTNTNALIGQIAVLQTDYTILEKSSVKFGDVIWTVKAIEDETLEKGTMIEVVAIEGNTLIVKKLVHSDSIYAE